MDDAPPPSYQQATGGSNHPPANLNATSPTSPTTPGGGRTSSSMLHPSSAGPIPTEARRSMEDEARSLPAGWVRQFDSQHSHQFFVDTNANPPRSIWHHPYDDETYLSTLPSEERERLEEQKRQAAYENQDTDEEGDEPSSPTGKRKEGTSAYFPPAYETRPGEASGPSTAPEISSSSSAPSSKASKLGRSLKDKLTSSTHEERVQARAKRDAEERAAYAAHLKAREALRRAVETGEPQYLGHDNEGHEIYVEPPAYGGGFGYGAYPGGAAPMAGPGRVYGGGSYSQGGGVYANPNARFIRPRQPYQRPYGPGYGGGMMPIGAGIGAGLLGGALLGGLMF